MNICTEQSVFAFPDTKTAHDAFVRTIRLLNPEGAEFAAVGLVVRGQDGWLGLQGVSPAPLHHRGLYDSFVDHIIDICSKSQPALHQDTARQDSAQQEAMIMVSASGLALEQIAHTLQAFSTSTVY